MVFFVLHRKRRKDHFIDSRRHWDLPFHLATTSQYRRVDVQLALVDDELG